MEYAAARAALELACSNINARVGTGVHTGQMDLEFHAERLAREALELITLRIDLFKAGRAGTGLQARAASR
jgi:hypothetical protein